MYPLKAALGTTNEIITDKDYNVLFPNVEIIVNLNSELLTALQERFANWSQHQKIGDVLFKRVRNSHQITIVSNMLLANRLRYSKCISTIAKITRHVLYEAKARLWLTWIVTSECNCNFEAITSRKSQIWKVHEGSFSKLVWIQIHDSAVLDYKWNEGDKPRLRSC